MSLAAVILAAGKSTRMKSALPKAVHPICGKPVTRHVVDACFAAGVDQIVVVVGHEAEAVKAAIGSDVKYVLQEQQLGTGHAAMQAMPLIDRDDVLILPGDAPLITGETLSKFISFHRSEKAAATLLTAILDEPGSYGRVVRGADGSVARITEARDASPEVLAIRECAMSIYCFSTPALNQSLSELSTDNAQGEYYLTDTIEILGAKGEPVKAIAADDPRDTLGINNRAELAGAAAIMRGRILNRLMLDGVTVVDPGTTYVDAGVTIGRDTVIKPCTTVEGNTVVGSFCSLGPCAGFTNCRVGNNVTASYCAVSEVTLEDGAVVQPFERVS